MTEEDITIALLTSGEVNVSTDEFGKYLPILIKSKLCYVSSFYMSKDQFVFKIKFPCTRLKVNTGWPIDRTVSYYYDNPIGKEVRSLGRGWHDGKSAWA